MKAIYQTNNPVELSWICALLEEAGFDFMIADQFTSVMEGSIGAIPRRVLVAASQADAARKLIEAEQGKHV